MEVNEIISKIKDFLERTYSGKIAENKRKELYSLDIDFRLLSEFDFDLAEMLLDNFEDAAKMFELALEQMKDEEGPGMRARFFNLSQTCERDIWKLRAKDIFKLVTIKGYIRKIGDVQHAIKAAKFECPSCGNILNVLMLDDIFKTPSKCGCGRKEKFHCISKELVDVQKLVLEEDPMVVKPPQKPRTIMAIMENDLCRAEIDKTLQPSKKIAISGLVKDRQVKPFLVECRKFIDVNSIRVVDEGISTVKISEKDIQKFKKMLESPTLYEDLAQSIIPNIYGHVIAKEAILCQLVGGVALYKDDQLEERGVMHILLIGPPGQGKSVMLKRAVLFMFGFIFTGGKGASGVGLVAAVAKDEDLGGWTLDAGAVPRASGAMCAIDELDKISKEDRSHMNNCMVDMQVRLDKATIHAILECETMILGAANPKDRIFERHQLIWKQIGLTKDFLDRFDLIFIIQSSDKEEEKKKVADLVVGKYIEESTEANPIYPHDLVVKYIAYARQNFKPKITKEIQEYIVENFLNIVKPIGPEEETDYFSYRLLTNIIRLTQAVTKIRHTEDITTKDAQRAINILIESLKQQEIITKDNLFDYEKAEAITPKKKRDAIKIVKQIIRELQENTGIPGNTERLANYDDIKAKAAEFQIDVDTLDEMLELLKRPGDLIEKRRDKYQLQ
jgi:DNA replicative helicase MCM subunit Mcm2 (Cdc46/Mcm family)